MLKVELLEASPLSLAIKAARVCYLSESKGEEHDLQLLRSIMKKDHTSVIEHIKYTFHIKGVSRAVLQELARHRIASLSVQSTRYTLKKILQSYDDLDDLIVKTGNPTIDTRNKMALVHLRTAVKDEELGKLPNDLLKYMLPEALAIELIWSINARSLRNFFKLRLSPNALWEIRALAQAIRAALPKEHDVLYEDIEVK